MLSGKCAAVFGVANERSLAWEIARCLSENGARVCVGYQNDRLANWVTPLTESLEDAFQVACDVTEQDQVEGAFDTILSEFGRLDCLVHGIAYANRQDLKGRYLDTSREGFVTALEASAYTLVSLCRGGLPLFERAGGGSVLTLTARGSRSVLPGYNVMGVAKAALEASVRYLAHDLGPYKVRVNALSAGPVSTLSSKAIPGFGEMKRIAAERAPLERNIEGREVGKAAVFLASDLASAVTGEILHVDAGEHIVA